MRAGEVFQVQAELENQQYDAFNITPEQLEKEKQRFEEIKANLGCKNVRKRIQDTKHGNSETVGEERPGVCSTTTNSETAKTQKREDS